MSIYYNGLTSVKKLLNKYNPYVKAYVGGNLVHTGTTLYNYIDWKVDGSYIVVKASMPLATNLDIVFWVNYTDHMMNSSEGYFITLSYSESKYFVYRQGYNYEQTIATSPSFPPSPPSGFERVSTTITNVASDGIDPTSDELYTYQFRAMS